MAPEGKTQHNNQFTLGWCVCTASVDVLGILVLTALLRFLSPFTLQLYLERGEEDSKGWGSEGTGEITLPVVHGSCLSLSSWKQLMFSKH